VNELIQELARKTVEAVQHKPNGICDMNKYNQKFAELIVRECADIAQQHNKSPVAAPLAIGYVIREHFGVEE
jgi:hypothetical protein